MSRRCKGLTKKGKPCMGGAMAGSDFCGPHTDFRPKSHTPAIVTVVHMDWDDPECVKGYVDEMDRIFGV